MKRNTVINLLTSADSANDIQSNQINEPTGGIMILSVFQSLE